MIEDVKENQPLLEEEEFKEPSLISRLFRIVVVLVVAVGLIYLSGVYQYFFFQRTSPSLVQEDVQVALEAERLVVPLTIFILANNDSNGSRRSQESASHLAEQADRVWEQASIDLEIKALHVLEVSDEQIEMMFDNAYDFVQTIEQYDPFTINVFLVGNLQGLNGVAYGSISAIAVADYTTVYDFRALAHEIGHKLSLSHVVNEQRLMHQGANGFELSLQEVMQARDFAERFD